MQIKTSRKSGFTLVEIMIVVAIIGLLAAIAIPNFVRARESAQLNSIANNLRILEGAKEQWALENKKATTDTLDLATVTTFLKNNTLANVAGEAYTFAQVGQLVTAAYTGVLAGKTGPYTVTSF